MEAVFKEKMLETMWTSQVYGHHDKMARTNQSPLLNVVKSISFVSERLALQVYRKQKKRKKQTGHSHFYYNVFKPLH